MYLRELQWNPPNNKAMRTSHDALSLDKWVSEERGEGKFIYSTENENMTLHSLPHTTETALRKNV